MKITKYSASWCGPCKMIQPVWEQFKQKYPEVEFEEIDVDENRHAATQAGIISLPTFKSDTGLTHVGANVTVEGFEKVFELV